ncbi:MAG: hypothetical protein FJ298_01440 [Planctomycetes bacterium]|nr:hypothetical protein [Planctomycetota bacterium]
MSIFALALALPLVVARPRPQEGWTALPLPALCTPKLAPVHPIERLQRGYHILFDTFSSECTPRPAEAALGAAELGYLLADESAREDGALRLLGTAPPLLARGTKADLERARATLADLDALGKALEIELRAWWLPQSDPLPVWPDDAAARARIGTAEPLGAAVVRSGGSVDLGRRTERTCVVSFDVEVASDANVAEPRIGRVASGRTLHARVARVDGGRSVLCEGLLDLSLELPALQFDPESSDLGVFEQPRVGAVQVAFAGQLASGGWLAVSIRGHGQHDGVLLVAARTASDPGGTLRWRGFDVAALAQPLLDWPMPEASLDALFEESEPEHLREALPAAEFASVAASALGAAKRGKLGSFDSSGSLGPVWGEGLLLLPASETAAVAEVESLVQASESERTRSHALLVRQGALEVHLPVCDGSFVRVLAVDERTALFDYDVEIAEDAWIPTPRVRRVLSGLVLDGHVQGGALALRGWRVASEPDVRVDKTRANLGALTLQQNARTVLAARVGAGSTRELLPPDPAHPALSLTLSPAR